MSSTAGGTVEVCEPTLAGPAMTAAGLGAGATGREKSLSRVLHLGHTGSPASTMFEHASHR